MKLNKHTAQEAWLHSVTHYKQAAIQDGAELCCFINPMNTSSLYLPSTQSNLATFLFGKGSPTNGGPIQNSKIFLHDRGKKLDHYRRVDCFCVQISGAPKSHGFTTISSAEHGIFVSKFWAKL
jgi:hypothetical protein